MEKSVQYPYAYDENNNLVFIGDIEQEHRHDHTYHCPGCGHTMLPRLGEHNEKHFYHSENQACGGETYIHYTAKQIIADRFNKQSEKFLVGITSERLCKQASTCKEEQFNCHISSEHKDYDLKLYYSPPAMVEEYVRDTDNEALYKPDVLLKSKGPTNKDIFIEIYHKSKSKPKKVNSDNPIIEIRVKSMEDLRRLETLKCLSDEDDAIRFYNFKDRAVSPDKLVEILKEEVEDRGGSLTDSILPPCKQSREYRRKDQSVWRVTLFKSGKSFSQGLYEEDVNRHKPSAIIDITWDSDKIPRHFNPRKLLAKRYQCARFCEWCDHCITAGALETTWCNIWKNGSTKKGNFDNTKGSTCDSFEWRKPTPYTLDTDLGDDSDLIEGVDFTVWINPDVNR